MGPRRQLGRRRTRRKRIMIEAIDRYDEAKAKGEEPHDHDVPGRD